MKPSYRFFQAADKRQDDIWHYTESQWGEAQAQQYIRGLHAHLQQLADQKLPWRSLSAIAPAGTDWAQHVYISRYKKHLIFFRTLDPQTIGIMSLLHEKMDLSARLLEDMQGI